MNAGLPYTVAYCIYIYGSIGLHSREMRGPVPRRHKAQANGKIRSKALILLGKYSL
jgi:hypothetical protein